MKFLIKICNIILFLIYIGNITYAEILKGDELRENIVKRLPNLNHTKLKALMNRVGKKPPKNFYNCLCRRDGGGAAGGVGISYHPEPLKPYDERYSCNQPGDPCMAQGYGCWRFPLPNDVNMSRYCIKHGRYDDNSTIVDAIVSAVKVLHSGRSPKIADIGLQSLLKDLFEKACLPVPESIDNLNPHKMGNIISEIEKRNNIANMAGDDTWSQIYKNSTKVKNTMGVIFDNVLDKNHIASMTQTQALANIYENAMISTNICESAIETKLLTDATKGVGILGTAGSLVWTIKGKDEFDLFKGYGNHVSQKVTKSIMGGIASGGAEFIKGADYYNKFRNIIDTYQKNIDNHQRNVDILDALETYRKSKNWDLKKINRVISRWDKSFINLNNAIDNIERRRKEKVEPIDKEEEILGKALLEQVNKNPNMAPPMNYNNPFVKLQLKRNEINRKADKEIEIKLLTITSNKIKRDILEKYRKPLIDKSCNEYIDERLRNCIANQGREHPLTHKEINKLWKETQNKYQKWKSLMKYHDDVQTEELKQAPLRQIQK